MVGIERKTVSVNGNDWHVATSGESGPVILLVHGFPLDHTMWNHQLEGLSDAARLIAPDLPGFGNSPPAAEPFSMELAADGLAGLLDAMQIDTQVVFCGLSMGGYIGWQFWRRHRAKLAGMICCDTRSAADEPEVARGREMMAARVRSEGTSSVAAAMVPKLFASEAATSNSVAVRETAAVISATDAEAIATGQEAMAVRVDATAWLPAIDCRTLVVVGAEDAITSPAEMREMSGRIPNAEFCELHGAGHMSPLERPDAFNERVREFFSQGFE